MALTKNWNIEWLSHNSQRKFPLAADASSRDVTGDFSLPDDFIVSLYLSIPLLAIDPGRFIISSVQVFATGYAVTVGYVDEDSAVTIVAAASILKATHTQNKTYVLRGLGDFYDARGQLVIGSLDNIDTQPPGQWEFDLAGGRLETDAIRPYLRGVNQLRVRNGADLSEPITGDVILRAGANMRITPLLVAGEDPVLVFDAIEGEGLNEDCVCADDVAETPPIRTINNVAPGPDGNFTLLGNACLTLEAIENGLQANDTCSQPCCGCKELEVITQSMEAFGRQAATLENQLTSLEARVSQMDMVVLGSRLGDQGCFTEQ